MRVFAEEGLEVSLGRIAQRTGTGHAAHGWCGYCWTDCVPRPSRKLAHFVGVFEGASQHGDHLLATVSIAR
ncbi:hypothetical protein [Streptosporangium roseum]|uniref:hypothetical protein n=1 Tax=Streptosporangium roseum TaxID=2001 RepID=UPI0004CD9121|nr:hypothetical protein [Streptosporangium roseum]